MIISAMAGEFLTTIHFLLCIRFCVGNWPIEEPFPSCNSPIEKEVNVKRGENMTLLLTLVDYHSTHDRNTSFAWFYGSWNEICTIPPGQSCVKNGETNSKLMSVNARAIKPNNFQRTDTYYDFNLTLLNSSFGDNGNHFIHQLKSDNQRVCKIISVNIIVRDIPLCTSVITKTGKHMNFSCSWIPLDYRDRIQLRTGNKTMQSYEREWIPDTETTSTYRNITIRVTVSIQDAFDKNRIPDTCIVSNNRFDFRNRCTFPIDMYLIPKMHEINEYGQNVSFTCCTNSDNLPDVWWYENVTKAMKAKGRVLTITYNTSSKTGGDDRKKVLLIFCGERNDAELSSFRMGQLMLNLRYHRGVFLSGTINHSSSTLVISDGDKTCNHSYLITLTANPLTHDYSTPDITSYKGNIASSISDSRTPNSPNMISLLTNHDKCSGVCSSLEKWISPIAIFAIFIFVIIAVCVRKCYKVKLRNRNTCTPVAGNNPQVDLRSRHGSDDETYAMAPVSLELSLVANKESCPSGTSTVKSRQQIIPSSPRNKFRWRQSEKRQQESTIPKRLLCSKSLTLTNHPKNETMAKYNSLAVTSQTLDEYKSSVVIYHTIDDDEPSRRIYQTLDEDKTSSQIHDTLNENKSSAVIYHTIDDKLSPVIYQTLEEEKPPPRIDQILNESKSLAKIHHTLDEDKPSLVIYHTLEEEKPSPDIHHTLDEDKPSTGIYQNLDESKSPPGIYQILNESKSLAEIHHTLDEDKQSLVIYHTLEEEKPSPDIHHTLDEDKPSTGNYQNLDADKSSPVTYKTLDEDKPPPGIYQNLDENKSPPGIYQSLNKNYSSADSNQPHP